MHKKEGEFISMAQISPEVIQRLIMPVDTNINLDSVILSDVNREKIQQFLKETQHSADLPITNQVR